MQLDESDGSFVVLLLGRVCIVSVRALYPPANSVGYERPSRHISPPEQGC